MTEVEFKKRLRETLAKYNSKLKDVASLYPAFGRDMEESLKRLNEKK